MRSVAVLAVLALSGCAELQAIQNIGTPGAVELSTAVLADLATARKIALADGERGARDVECVDRWAAIITPLMDGDTNIPGAATLIVFKRAAQRVLNDCPLQFEIPGLSRLIGIP